MRRIRIAGVGLIVTLISSVVLAANASAALEAPEYGRCLKHVGGMFKNTGCDVDALIGEVGKYEWYPADGEPSPSTQEADAVTKNKFSFTVKTATMPKLETRAKAVVECTGGSGEGEYDFPKEVKNVSLELTGCKLTSEPGTPLCTSKLPQVEGTIAFQTLEGELGIEKKGATPAKNKIGLDLFAPGGGEDHTAEVASFTCKGALPVFSITGSVIHPLHTNAMLEQPLEKFTEALGKQKPEKFEGGAVDVLKQVTIPAGTEQIGLELETIVKNEEKLEVSSVQ
jgi:hypothetical protein